MRIVAVMITVTAESTTNRPVSSVNRIHGATPPAAPIRQIPAGVMASRIRMNPTISTAMETSGESSFRAATRQAAISIRPGAMSNV